MKCLSAHSFPFNCTPWSIYGVWTILMLKILQSHLLCAFVAKLKIYALYPESFCDKNLAIRKVFAFCGSVVFDIVLVFTWNLLSRRGEEVVRSYRPAQDNQVLYNDEHTFSNLSFYSFFFPPHFHYQTFFQEIFLVKKLLVGEACFSHW